jgi:Domain of unknown function (DUF4123)
LHTPRSGTASHGPARTVDRSVSIDGNESLSRSVALAYEIGKGEFWLGESKTELLSSHLRKLGAARMPDGQILYFRYYDPDVLAAIVPLVNAEQASYLFGPARVLGLVGGAADGAVVERPDGLPEPHSGPITFESWQIDILDDRQTEISHRKIAAMLRDCFKKEANTLSNSELYQFVKEADFEASSCGVTSESAHAKWAFLTMLLLDRPDRTRYLREKLISSQACSANDSVETNFEKVIKENFQPLAK